MHRYNDCFAVIISCPPPEVYRPERFSSARRLEKTRGTGKRPGARKGASGRSYVLCAPGGARPSYSSAGGSCAAGASAFSSFATVTLPSRTSTSAASPLWSVPSSISSAAASSTRFWMTRRSGRAP